MLGFPQQEEEGVGEVVAGAEVEAEGWGGEGEGMGGSRCI